MTPIERGRRAIAWLRRLPRTKGFGVQSPTDYRFCTQTLRAAVPALLSQQHAKGGEEYQWHRLAYVIAAAWRPAVFVNLTACEELNATVLMAHNRCVVGAEKALVAQATLVAVDAADLGAAGAQQGVGPDGNIAALLDAMAVDACLIVRHIRRNTACRTAWRTLCRHKRAVITFDLYSFGIVQTYARRYRQHYNINF